jgi:hypothetical protein
MYYCCDCKMTLQQTWEVDNNLNNVENPRGECIVHLQMVTKLQLI